MTGGWAEAGALAGIALGLLDGALAVGPSQATSARTLLALLAAVAWWAAAGALALPLAIRWLPGVPSRPPAQPVSAGRRALRVAALVAAAPALGFGFHRIAGVLAGFLPWEIRVLLVVAAAGGSLVALRRFTRGELAPLGRAATLLILFGAADVAVLAMGRSDLPLSGIEHGQGMPEKVVPPPDGPNVLLVVLDTTRVDHLQPYGYDRPTSPYLAALAGEGTLFEQATSTAPWTLPSHASMFTGQPPQVHRANKERYWLDDENTTLAEILRDRGYATVGFSSVGLVSSTYNMNQGFEQFFEVFRFAGGGLIAPVPRLKAAPFLTPLLGSGGLPDKGGATVVRLWRNWLDEHQGATAPRPFFAFVHLFEAHLPYKPPAAERQRFVSGPVRPAVRDAVWHGHANGALFRAMVDPNALTVEDLDQIRELYDAEIAYEDARLREIVEELRSRGLLDQTLVLITADHGENLGEHGGLMSHAFSLHQTLLHVPLVVRYPALFPAGRREPRLVSSLSLFPTVLAVTGASFDPRFPPVAPRLPYGDEDPVADLAVAEYGVPTVELYQLVSLVPGADVSRYAIRQTAVLSGGWKLVLPSAGEPRLYDLRSDPHEDNPMDVRAHPEGARLTLALTEFFAHLPPPIRPEEAPGSVIDEQTRRALRSVGYLQ